VRGDYPDGRATRIVYLDRHLDLNTPQSTDEGSLSWMGRAHALGLPGTGALLPEMQIPLLTPADLVYLGVDREETTEGERKAAAELRLTVVAHVDVDVLDAPIAENVNGRTSGPTIAQLGAALSTLWNDPQCRALSIGQLDPAHAASDPTALPRPMDALTDALCQ